MATSSESQAALEQCFVATQAQQRLLLEKTQARMDALEKGEKSLARGKQKLEQREEALKKVLEEQEVAMKKRKKELAEARRQLEEEKASMTKPGVGPEDIIGLNVGGEKLVQVNRSLLLQFKDSMLASMFSGRHEEGLNRDAQGNVFFDYAPAVFYPLIEILRARRDGEQELAPPEVTSDKEKKAWDLMVDFMMLPSCLKHHVFFTGIQCDVQISALRGWRTVFCKPYWHTTTTKDLEIPEGFRRGSVLLGAKRKGSDTLALAAMGDYEVVVARLTKGNDTKEHNGAFWYFDPKRSIGFSPVAKVMIDCDGDDLKECQKDSRLGWRLNGKAGGTVGGKWLRDHIDSFEKVLMLCPLPVPRP